MTLKSLDYFASLVRQDDSIPLFETALSIGQDVYPHLDFTAHQLEIDTIGSQLLKRIPADASHIQKLRMLNHLFFQEMGFAGNINNFYDADNSYVHRVMATRRGIPISLAVIFMELGQQIGLDMKGISFPGHFLMKLAVQSGEIVLDPINGNSLSREELEERIEPFLQQQGELGEMPLAGYLRAAHPREIVERMLRNLKAIFIDAQRWQRVLDVQQRLIVLLPDDINERRDRGLTHANLADPQAALEDLEAYLALRPDAADAAALQEKTIGLRAALRRH
ncbi:MAG: transglutaminase [Herbaspirillum sp.]|jgi:regulator of sirC expression with transglutaminase-like and TPR domain|nr:transglutaminase [Herbaspirillum sp.]